MRTTTPRQFPTLRVSDGDSLRSGHEAVPDLLDQLQPILDTEREGVLQYRAHASIVRWQPSGRKSHLSTHNDLALSGRPSDVGLHRCGWRRAAQVMEWTPPAT